MKVVKHGYDSTANDSDKTIVVPAGEVWQLDWLHAILASTATVGNRLFSVALYDQAGVLQADWLAGATQAASLSRHYIFTPGVYRETAFVNGEIQVAIPHKLIIPSKWYLRAYDSAAIDAAADDLTLSYQVTKLVGN